MKQALGLVEISGLSTAVVVADTMAKAANIRILEIENTKGLGYMTLKIIRGRRRCQRCCQCRKADWSGKR